MNATLCISVFAQTNSANNRTISDVELTIRDIDSADVPTELINRSVLWHNAISVSYDEADRTLIVEKPAGATCEDFDKLVGTEIAAKRRTLAATRRANKNVFIRETELHVPTAMIDTILARTSGYANDLFTDPFGNDDALGMLLGLTSTDFGATDLFTEAYSSDDIINLNDAATLV
jgi:hypothetical protein